MNRVDIIAGIYLFLMKQKLTDGHRIDAPPTGQENYAFDVLKVGRDARNMKWGGIIAIIATCQTQLTFFLSQWPFIPKRCA